jgi:hypothetical protein
VVDAEARLGAEALARRGNRGGVAVERDQTAARPERGEDRGGMAAAAEGAIDVAAVRGDRQGRQGLGEEDRLVRVHTIDLSS